MGRQTAAWRVIWAVQAPAPKTACLGAWRRNQTRMVEGWRGGGVEEGGWVWGSWPWAGVSSERSLRMGAHFPAWVCSQQEAGKLVGSSSPLEALVSGTGWRWRCASLTLTPFGWAALLYVGSFSWLSGCALCILAPPVFLGLTGLS